MVKNVFFFKNYNSILWKVILIISVYLNNKSCDNKQWYILGEMAPASIFTVGSAYDSVDEFLKSKRQYEDTKN